MIGPDERTPREIRDGIRRTRAQMDATVDAIEEKLTPGELFHEAWTFLRGGPSSSVSRVFRIAKQHPMPAAIISLGVSWMVYESAGGGSRTAPVNHLGAGYTDDRQWSGAARESSIQGATAVRRAAGSVFDKAGDLTDNGRDMAHQVAGSIRRATDAATDAAGSAIDKAAEVAGHARDIASDVAGSVGRQASEAGRQASELGGQAREGMRQVRTGFWDMLEGQPLVVGAATLAAGLLVGLLLPSTPREDELMGKARDSLVEEVKGFGQVTLEKGKQVVSAAADTLRQGAEAHGVNADAVADKLRSVGRDVVETVKAEVQKQNPVAPDQARDAAQDVPEGPKHQAA